MKRLVSFLLLFVLVFTSSQTLATVKDKLANHWAKEEIDGEFLEYYFPYLSKGNFQRFNPDSKIRENEFLLSFTSLLRDMGYSNNELGWDVDLTRKQMARIVGGKLLEENIIEKGEDTGEFKDIKNCSKEIQESIIALKEAGLIRGEKETRFNPNRPATQGEAIVFLQRVESLFKASPNLSFRLLGIMEAYSGTEGINLKEREDKLIVSITKAFPNPGYAMEVDKIVQSRGEYKIYLNIIPPDKDSIQLQVITYKTITIEINKDELGNPPYIFKMEGNFYQNFRFNGIIYKTR